IVPSRGALPLTPSLCQTSTSYNATARRAAAAYSARVPQLRVNTVNMNDQSRTQMTAFKSDFLNVLQSRGFIHQISDPDSLGALAARGALGPYIGFHWP